jgi:putative type I restriction enzyme specificity protein HI_0216
MDMQSKAKKLIEMIQTAPVEWKPLGEVCLIADNLRKPVKASLRVAGKIPYYGANNIQDYVDGYTHDGEFLLIAEDGSASLTNYSIQWVVGKFWANNHVHVVQGNKLLNNRFLFHYLRQMNFIPYLVGGDRAKLTKAKMLEIKIPIPSLETQQKIVKILDKFTELESTLEAELALRKRQYRYYRDFLLDFDNQIGGEIVDGYKGRLKDVVWKTLGEVFNIFAGGDVPKDAFSEVETEEFCIPILSNGIGSKALYGWTNVAKINQPSLTISARGTIGWASFQNKPFFPIVRLLVLTPKIELNLKYAYYFMKSIESNYKVPESGIPQLTKPMIKDISIPIPPLPEQEKIVAILDKFDTLTHSISEGLPHEIALRRKQYEYYREQLLAFPKTA